MANARDWGRAVTRRVGPRVAELAPDLTSGFVHQALSRAIHGVGPLPGAAAAAEKQLREHRGDEAGAVSELIESHVRMAGAQGFVTNIGGLVTMTFTIPANISGLALIECRLVAAIAHLRGYDLEDPRTANAILAALLGEDQVHTLVKRKRIPGPPMALATAPAYDPQIDRVVANEVAAELASRVAGKRLATVAGRRVPVVGGLVGAGADGFATWKIGRYADRELLPRTRR